MQGFQAVEYAYGDEGTWKKLGQVKYEHNLFQQHATDSQPLDVEALEVKCSTQVIAYIFFFLCVLLSSLIV